MNCFKLLADNYSEHSIRKAISLESSFIFFKKSTFSSSFVSLITLSLVIKLSLVPGPWGQYLLVLCQGALQNNQSCSRTLLVEVPQHEECNALLLWWSLNDKSFYKQLTVFRVMNMQWHSLVLKHRNRGWHPPPSRLELLQNCLMNCLARSLAQPFSVVSPSSKGSCPV